MKYVALDTNAYRALDDGNAVVAQYVQAAMVVGMPAIVLGELYFGFENGTRKSENLSRLERFRTSQRVEVLELTSTTPRIFGEIAAELEKAGQRIQQNDVWIAALCKEYGFGLLTADKGFVNITGLDTVCF